jgi:hypothetical protein
MYTHIYTHVYIGEMANKKELYKCSDTSSELYLNGNTKALYRGCYWADNNRVSFETLTAGNRT